VLQFANEGFCQEAVSINFLFTFRTGAGLPPAGLADDVTRSTARDRDLSRNVETNQTLHRGLDIT